MIDRPYRLTLNAPEVGKNLTLLVKGAQLVGRSDVDTNHMPDVDLKSLGAWNAGVSRRHLVMNPFEDDIFFVKDLGSANGTRINGELLKSGMVYSLHSGDSLTVGTLNMVVTFMPATTTEIEDYQNAAAELEVSNFAADRAAAGYLSDEGLDRSATVYRRSTLRILEHLPAEDPTDPAIDRGQCDEDNRSCLTPDERDAINMLKEFVHTRELGENTLFYIARDAVHNPYWRVNRRIAVLQAAAQYGYVSKDNAELAQEERRMNQMRHGRGH
jgi:hypothetical protein